MHVSVYVIYFNVSKMIEINRLPLHVCVIAACMGKNQLVGRLPCFVMDIHIHVVTSMQYN